MQLRSALLAVLVAGAVYNGWQRFEARPVHPGDGVLAPDDPVQTNTDPGTPIRRGRWTLIPRAHYALTARILGRENYYFDGLAALVPEDLALGWGEMSDNRVLAGFDISQSARFYTWRPRGALPIAREEVITHSANTHVIPADDEVRAQLARLRVGQVVHFEGLLVDAARDDGARARTSMTRTDSGAGACEIMLVQSVALE
jgi:hypothetical protein